MKQFEVINEMDLTHNVFHEIGKRWMLISAMKDGVTNTMTASWGGMGVLWNQNVVMIFVRPQRYTKQFIDAADTFSITFFDETYRKELAYLGKVSGKDEDKIAKCHLHVQYEKNTPYFAEGSYTMICRKLYAQAMQKDCFIDPNCLSHYADEDYHILYVGEILKVLKAV